MLDQGGLNMALITQLGAVHGCRVLYPSGLADRVKITSSIVPSSCVRCPESYSGHGTGRGRGREMSCTEAPYQTYSATRSSDPGRTARTDRIGRKGRTRGSTSAPRKKFESIFFFFQAEDGIRDYKVTGVQTCALPI